MVSAVRGAMIAVTLICWGMSLYKLRDLARDPRNQPLRALCLALLAITLSLTLQPAAPAVDQFSGILNLARMTSNCLSLICATAAQAFLLHMTGSGMTTRRRVRLNVIALTVCLTVIVILFAVTAPPTTVDDPRVLSGEYYSDAYTAPFFWVYLAFLTWLLVQITMLSTRYARIAHRPLLRFGLRTIAVGAVWGLAYVVMRMVAAIVAVLEPGRRLPLPIDAGVVLSFTTSILLVLIGSTIPSWGPLLRVDRVWFWIAALRDCRRLHPLWQRIYQVVPEVVLLPPQPGLHGAIEQVRDASLRRVRITMEILDGYAMLRPWTSHQVLTHARHVADSRGLTGDRHTAWTEAVVISAALHSRQRGEPAADDPDNTPHLPLGPGRQDAATGEVTAAEQMIWLAMVAAAIPTRAVATAAAHAGRSPAAAR